jgi:hypothetical protein
VPELPKPLQDLLTQLGLTEESIQSYKFGGVVGKVSLIALGAFVAAMGTAKLTTGWVQAVCVIATLATGVLIIRWILDYAEDHPESATLEGSQIIVWKHQKVILAAKGMMVPEQSPIVPNPEGAVPQLNPPQGTDQ